MDENPYEAPRTMSAGGSRYAAIRVAAAGLVTALGMLIGIVTARHGLSLFSGPGPERDVAMFGFPTNAAAAVGSFVLAIGITRARVGLSAVGLLLLIVGIGGWFLFIYAATHGWFR